MARSRLQPVNDQTVPGGIRQSAGFLESDGDRHEKSGLGSNGAGNDIGFGSCGGYAGQGDAHEGAAAGTGPARRLRTA